MVSGANLLPNHPSTFLAYLPEASGRRMAEGLWACGGTEPPGYTPKVSSMRSLLGGDGNFEHVLLLYLVSFPVHDLKRMFTFDPGGKTFPRCLSQVGLLELNPIDWMA